MRKAILSACCVFALLAAPLPVAAGQPAHHARGHTTLSDWQFMRKAAAAGQALLAAGKLAQKKAGTAEVRRFGEVLVRETAAVNRRLSLLSLYAQVPLPSRPAKNDRRALDALRPLQGPAFDRAFLRQVHDVQQRAIALYRAEADSPAADDALRAFARDCLPNLQALAQSADQLQAGPQP